MSCSVLQNYILPFPSPPQFDILAQLFSHFSVSRALYTPKDSQGDPPTHGQSLGETQSVGPCIER